MSACLCMTCLQYLRGPEEGVGAPTLKLQMAVSCHAYHEPGSSAKASALNHGAIPPAPLPYFMRPETHQSWPVSLRDSHSPPPQHWN